MSEIRIQATCYHPAELNKPQADLFDHIIEERQIAIGQTFELPLSAAVTQDKRPLMFALRRASDGSTSALASALFTVTGRKRITRQHQYAAPALDDRMSETLWSLLIPLHSDIGSDQLWHAYFVRHDDAVEMRRMHITWGAAVGPNGEMAPAPSQTEEDVVYALRYDEISATLAYKGEALPGVVDGEASWRIQRITFGATDDDVTVEWADGDSNFDKIWANRASLSYS